MHGKLNPAERRLARPDNGQMFAAVRPPAKPELDSAGIQVNHRGSASYICLRCTMRISTAMIGLVNQGSRRRHACNT
jgi:hypothetical protein